MNKNLIVVDDQNDILLSIKSRICSEYPDYVVTLVSNCDTALVHLQKTPPLYDLLILDLEFYSTQNHNIKNGKALLKELKVKGIEVPVIIYTSDANFLKLQPIINTYNPQAIVTKDEYNYTDLNFAIKKVLAGGKFYTDEINRKILKRIKLKFKIDATNERIIENLPHINKAEDWNTTNVGISSKQIKVRLEQMYIFFNVTNDKQLLLELMRQGFIK